MDYIQGDSREQTVLFPECLDDYVGEDNPVRLIDAFVDRLDMQWLGFRFAILPETGRPPYNPLDLLKLYIYGYFYHVRSSRNLMREARRNIEVMWLMKRVQPDFHSISRFRKRNKRPLQRVFREFTKCLKGLGLIGGETVAIDGSKFKASNALNRSYNAKIVSREIQKIDQQIARYFKELSQTDKAEKDMPEDDRVIDIEAKLKQLDQEVQGLDIAMSDQQDNEEETNETKSSERRLIELKKRRDLLQKIAVMVEESADGQVCLTDPDARRMKGSRNHLVGYNAQIAVDAKNSLIAHLEVTQARADSRQLSRMAIRTKEIVGAGKLTVLADRGYFSNEEILACHRADIMTLVPKQEHSTSRKRGQFTKADFTYTPEEDVYLCPANEKLKLVNTSKPQKWKYYQSIKACKRCAIKNLCCPSVFRRIGRYIHEEVIEKAAADLKKQPQAMIMRKKHVEHPFGFLKQSLGMREFLSRGLDNVGAEMSLAGLSFNLKRAIKLLGVRTLISAMA